MTNVQPVVVKFVTSTLLLASVLGMLYHADFWTIVKIGVVVTALGYFAGDKIILPKWGNLMATVADFGLVYIVVWLMGAFLFNPGTPLATASFYSAVIVALGEYLFHVYLQMRGGGRERTS